MTLYILSSSSDDGTVGMPSSQYSIFVELGDDDAGKTTKKPKRSDHRYHHFHFSLVLLT
jgi:hypothetical protein